MSLAPVHFQLRVHLRRRIEQVRRRIGWLRLENRPRWHRVELRQRADVIRVLLRGDWRLAVHPVGQQRAMSGLLAVGSLAGTSARTTSAVWIIAVWTSA